MVLSGISLVFERGQVSYTKWSNGTAFSVSIRVWSHRRAGVARAGVHAAFRDAIRFEYSVLRTQYFCAWCGCSGTFCWLGSFFEVSVLSRVVKHARLELVAEATSPSQKKQEALYAGGRLSNARGGFWSVAGLQAATNRQAPR